MILIVGYYVTRKRAARDFEKKQCIGIIRLIQYNTIIIVVQRKIIINIGN